MDSGDWDSDGDIDLALGSLGFEVSVKPQLVEEWVRGGVPFVVLEDSTISK